MRNIETLAAFILYFAVMIIIGIFYSGKNKNSSDFFLGGRKVGPWTTALSAEASDMSGWLLMGLPALAYLTGMKEAFWIAAGLTMGTYLNWLFIAKPLRKYTIHSGNSITIPEFFTNRFNDSSRILALIAVIFILLFFTIYTASGFVACAKLFKSVFGIPYFNSLILSIIIILSYTLTGGYFAVCATDLIQGTLMIIALSITAGLMIYFLGGIPEATAAVSAYGDKFLNPFTSASDDKFGAIQILSSLGWGLGYFGMPHILVRFMGIRANKEIKISRRIALIWVIIAFTGSLLVGAFGKAYLTETLTSISADTVFIKSILKMYPPFIGGIFLCGIFAAAMSTSDSQLLVGSSAFSRDIFKPFIKKDATGKQELLVSRLTVVVLALIAFFIAMDPTNTVLGLVKYAWAGFGATFGPIIILSLFWRNTTRNGALWGLILGGITVLIWKPLSGGIFDLYEIIPGFIVCLLTTIIVSSFDKKDPEVLAEFDSYKKLK